MGATYPSPCSAGSSSWRPRACSPRRWPGAFDLLQGAGCAWRSATRSAWCLSCQGTQLRVAQREAVDVCIRGTWRDFLLLASRQEDPDTLFFRRRLVIEGDTDFGAWA